MVETTTRRALSSAEKHSEQRPRLTVPAPVLHWLISGNPLAAAWGSDVARILWLKHEEHQGNLAANLELKSLTERGCLWLCYWKMWVTIRPKYWNTAITKSRRGVEWDTGDIKASAGAPNSTPTRSQTHQRWGESTICSIPHFSLDYFILLWIYLFIYMTAWVPEKNFYRRNAKNITKKNKANGLNHRLCLLSDAQRCKYLYPLKASQGLFCPWLWLLII